VKFPIFNELSEAVSKFVGASNGDHEFAPICNRKFFICCRNLKNTQQLCVSNPLIELFALLLKLDPKASSSNKTTSLSDAIKRVNLTELVKSFSSSFESLGIRNLLGGVTLDQKTRKIVGARALMLPYALRHSTTSEDQLAEKWELLLAKYLLGFQSPFIRISWFDQANFASKYDEII
jgi:hypothetical protein